MAGSPILPRTLDDPTGQDRRERGAMRAFSAKLRQVLRLYRSALDGIPFNVVTTNAKVYEYLLDGAVLLNLQAELSLAVDRILLEGGPDRLWFVLQYVIPGYQQGTAAQWANLGAQSVEYQQSRAALEQVLLSPAYQRRLGLIRARQFEGMVGFSATVKQQMARILTDGAAVGKGPLEIARDLSAQLGILDRRAQMISRTEIPGAFRTARMEEAAEAQVEFGWLSREMHLSALSPTTRPDHAARHAELYTIQAQKVWWSEDGNSINCKCSTVTVLVDAQGNPLSTGIVAKAKAMRPAT